MFISSSELNIIMPTYVYLVTLTERGRSNLKDVKKGGIEIENLIKNLEGHSRGSFMTLGRYDVVRIVDLPSDRAALQLSMKSAETSLENVETLKGFTSEEAEFSVV